MRLNQVIAIVSGKKTEAKKEETSIYHDIQRADVFDGMNRTYRPIEENGEQLPEEKKVLQLKSKDVIGKFRDSLTDLINLIATQDNANCTAKADIVVDEAVLAKDVPVTHLLFLEKKAIELGNFVSKIPVLDPAETWKFDEAQDCWVSDTHTVNRYKKVLRNHQLSPATDKHPAQVTTYNEDVLIGHYVTKKFSGKVSQKEKNEMLDRVRKLQEALKLAREHANNLEVKKFDIADDILNFVFGKR